MTITGLFKKRVWYEWRLQCRAWCSVTDWTVMLYVVIPAFALAVRQYLLWWREPAALTALPLSLGLAIAFSFTLTGNPRLFIDPADPLFLWQCRSWIQRLFIYSLCYSALGDGLTVGLLLLIALPWLNAHGFGTTAIIYFWVVLFLLRQVMGLGKQLLGLYIRGFWYYAVCAVAGSLMGFLFCSWYPVLYARPDYVPVVWGGLAICLFLLILIRLSVRGSFAADLARERQQRLRLSNMLLTLSGVELASLKPRRSRPFLGCTSQPFFTRRNTVNILIETGLKQILRNPKYYKAYLLLSGVCLLLLLSLPRSWQLLVWVGLAVGLYYFAALFWQEVFRHPFVRSYVWRQPELANAFQHYLFWAVLPGLTIGSLLCGWRIGGWAGAILQPFAGVILLWLTKRTAACSLARYGLTGENSRSALSPVDENQAGNAEDNPDHFAGIKPFLIEKNSDRDK